MKAVDSFTKSFKFFPYIFCFAALLLPDVNGQSVAQTKPAEQMTKEDFRNYYLQNHSRIPKNLDSTSIQDDTSKVDTSKPSLKKANEVLLPSKMIFPGEYEEVKAILITWPRVNGVLDFNNNSEYATIFQKIAKAIDDNAELWINIYVASDSTKIKNYMSEKGSPLKNVRFFIGKGDDFWYRDCGPVAFYYGDQDSIGFIDFEYYKGRVNDDKLPINVGKQLGVPVFTTSLEYEGGNILLDGCGNLFTTDAVYELNGDASGISGGSKKSLTKTQVDDSLKKFLNLKTLTVLPQLKFDGGTGHIDLYADLWDENHFVFSQMPSELSKLTDYPIINKNITTLMNFTTSEGKKYRKNAIPFPRRDDGKWYTSDADYEQYTYTYTNHLFVNETILQPVYGSETSPQIVKDLDSIKGKYPGYAIVPVNMSAFKSMGGALHCITKQIPAENPVRIIHVPLSADTLFKSEYAIKTQIYNKSGIERAVCKWRCKGESAWDSIQLSSANSSNFDGTIANTKSNVTIEYYIEATSKNGKTMTKPITAPAGFYSSKISGTTSTLHTQLDNSTTATFSKINSLGKMYLKTNLLSTNFELKLFDIAGKNVYSQKYVKSNTEQQFELDASYLRTGFYIAVLQTKDGIVYKDKITLVR